MMRRRSGGMSRGFERLRRTFTGLIARLTWQVGAPLRALRAWRDRRRLRRYAKTTQRRGPIASLESIARGAIYAVRSSFRFIWSLLGQGDIRYLVQGIPAVLVGGLICTIAGAAVLSDDVALTSRYQRAARTAMAGEKYRAAELYYERLAQLDGGSVETRYALALTAQALNQFDRTRSIMLKLAPKDGKGYGPAHLWLARYYVNVSNGNREVLREAYPHVTQALADKPDFVAHAVAGRFFAEMDQLEQAESHLVQAISLNAPDQIKTELRLSLARVYVLQNKPDLARPEAEAALNYLRRRSEIEPADHTVRLALSEAALFLEQFEEAERVLLTGMAMDLSRQPEVARSYANRMSQLYVTMATVLGRQGKSNLGQQLELMDKSLQYNPRNMAAIQAVTNISGQRGEAADQARALLKEALAKGIAPATAHFILGNVAWERGEADLAREELAAAYELAAHMPQVGNNLAWYLAESDAPNLSRALEIITGVLQVQPDHPSYRDTRGRILVKMGRWRDARIDLEIALTSMRDDPGIHNALATVYRNLNDPEMAAQHEKLATELAEKEKQGS